MTTTLGGAEMGSIGSAIYTGVAWVPGLAFATTAVVCTMSAMVHLEATFGATSYLI